jgi:hypothetical protein
LSQANYRPGASMRFATIAPLQKNFPRLSPSCNGSRTNGRSMPTARANAPAEHDSKRRRWKPRQACACSTRCSPVGGTSERYRRASARRGCTTSLRRPPSLTTRPRSSWRYAFGLPNENMIVRHVNEHEATPHQGCAFDAGDKKALGGAMRPLQATKGTLEGPPHPSLVPDDFAELRRHRDHFATVRAYRPDDTLL